MKWIYIIAILFSASANGQERSINFDLKDLKSRYELGFKDIKQVNSITFENAKSWRDGILGPKKAGQIGIKLLSADSSGTSLGLLIEQSAGKTTLSTCQNRRDCRALEGDGRKADVDLGGSRWEITTSSKICQGESECKIFIPSWSFEVRRVNQGNMVSFPKIMSVIAHKKGLSFYNADIGQHLFTLQNNDFQRKGAQMKADRLGENRFLIQDNSSALLFDWSRDQVIKITKDSVTASDSGIAGSSQNQFTSVHQFDGDAKRRFISMNDQFIVFNDLIVAWRFNTFGGFEILSSHYIDGEDKVRDFSFDQTNNYILTQNDQGYKVSKVDTVSRWDRLASFKFKGKGELKLFGERVYLLGKEGMKILEKNIFVPTSLSKTGSSLYIADKSHSFVQSFENSKCQWEHFQSHPKHPSSLSSKGFHVSCGILNGFSANRNSVNVTSFDGSKITVKGLSTK